MTPSQRAEALQLARESVSLLGAQKHMDTINRALDEFLLRILAAELAPEPVAVVYERAQGSFGITCLKPVWSGMKLYDHYEQAQDTTLMNLQDEVSNLTDELDQLRVDAMRYRWLTSNGLKLLAKDFPDRLSMMQEHTSDEIDAAVDAARGKSENL